MKAFRHRVRLLLALLLSPLWVEAAEYGATPIEAWIVDDQTGKPIEGVNVVAHWELEREVATLVPTMPFGNDPRGPLQLQIMETVTDANGRFYFPAWGPLSAPLMAYLKDRDPELVFFKEGYIPSERVGGHDPYDFDPSVSGTRQSWANGKTFKLKKFEGDMNTDAGMKAYAYAIETHPVSFFFYIKIGHTCDWTRTPRMFGTVVKLKQEFRAKLIPSSLPNLQSFPNQNTCGSAEELLKDYFK